MHDKGYMMLLMARDDAYKSNTSKQVWMRLETTYDKTGKTPYVNLEVGPDMKKHQVEVVKQQGKEHQEDLHEILVQLVRSYGLEDMSKTS